MSATRDKSQKISFVYSNLYQIYRKGLERAREGASPEASSASPIATENLSAPLAAPLALTTALKERLQKSTPFADESQLRKFQKHVLKSGDLRTSTAFKAPAPAAKQPVVSPYTPAELIGKRFAKPAVIAGKPVAQVAASIPTVKLAPVPARADAQALESLKDSLKSLNDLHARLRFMLQELEDLTKE